MKKKYSIEEDQDITVNQTIKVKSSASLRKEELTKIMSYRMALNHNNRRKQQPLLTALQTELLYRYTQEPTEKQKKHFEVFRFYLLVDDGYRIRPQHEIEAYAALPKKKLSVKREQLSPFQNNLLYIYDNEPTELQMQKLEDFLYKLFNNLLNKFDEKKHEAMVA
jgi:hypothetical protein